MFRTLTRARRQCLAESRCELSDPRFYNFSRLLLKNAEHDFGRSHSFMGSDASVGWTNGDFHKQLQRQTTAASGWNGTNECQPGGAVPCHLQDMVDSYVEERNWGLVYSHEALDDHPLRTEISAALASLQPERPDLAGWQRVADPAKLVDCGRWSVGFNVSTGAINHLVDSKSGVAWADSKHQLAEFVYQTFTAHDHNVVYMHEYMSDSSYDPTLGARLNPGFGKPGLNESCPHCERLDLRTTLRELWAAGILGPVHLAHRCTENGQRRS